MEKILENEQIYLRKLTVSDAIHFFNLNNDPDVLQFTGDKPFLNRKEAESFLAHYPNYKRDGYGRWAVCMQETDEFLGWCGLRKCIDSGQVDIGFRFYKKHWGKGYASVATKLCVNFGFNTLKLEQIVGNAYAENKASIRVLEKCGFVFQKSGVYDDKEAVFYTIHNLTTRLIDSIETHPLRASVLRENIPLAIAFKGDDDKNTFHLGVYRNKELVGVGSFMESSNDLFEEKQYQLRGMATSQSAQGRGVGKLLLKASEEFLKKQGILILWCNAREIALNFYEKQGFQIHGDSFEIKYIGTHFTMFKKIN